MLTEVVKEMIKMAREEHKLIVISGTVAKWNKNGVVSFFYANNDNYTIARANNFPILVNEEEITNLLTDILQRFKTYTYVGKAPIEVVKELFQ